MIETQTPKILRIVFCFVLLFLGDVGSQLALDYSGTKPRIICLHGHASSGAITKKQISIWPDIVLDKLDLVFIDALYPVQHSSHEDTDDPPYYEWWQTNENVTEIINLEESIEYLEANMIKHGPFDGVLGFSQGASIAAALPGMQREEVALTKVSRIKFVIIIAGAKLAGSNNLLFPLAVNAYSPPNNCPSLHFIGEMDFKTKEHNDLLSAFVDPVVIHHPEGHVIPHLALKSRQQKKMSSLCQLPHLRKINVTEIINLKESIDYLEANMIKHGPFDGVLGFSQGALIAAALPGMQREGVVLTKVSRIKFVIIIAGAKLGVSNNLLFPLAANAYSPPINCPSLHFIGEMDFLTKDKHNDLLSSFVDPVVIHHPEGHVIPQLDNNSLEVVLSFIKKTSQISKQDNFSYKM